MPDRKDVTTGYVMPPWVPEPTPGTAAARLMEESDAEVHAPLTAEGKWAHAWAADRIERRHDAGDWANRTDR